MKIEVLYKQVGQRPEVLEIEDDAAVIRELIGGHFSASPVSAFVPLPQLRNVWVYYHDEGKLIGLPFNCCVGAEPLVGNILFYAGDEHGEGMDMSTLQIWFCSFLCEFSSCMVGFNGGAL